jgi:hypothetical protein
MKPQLAIANDDDDHMFHTHATMMRGVLNEMQSREDFARTLRALDYVIAHFATLKLGSCSLNPPQTGWGRAIWSHLLAMADLKSHAEALAEARSIRDQFTVWPKVLGA